MARPINLDPTFGHGLVDVDNADGMEWAPKKPDLLQSQLAQSAMDSHGVCTYCLKPYADHDSYEQVWEHAEAQTNAQAEAKRMAATPRVPRIVRAPSLDDAAIERIVARVASVVTRELLRVLRDEDVLP